MRSARTRAGIVAAVLLAVAGCAADDGSGAATSTAAASNAATTAPTTPSTTTTTAPASTAPATTGAPATTTDPTSTATPSSSGPGTTAPAPVPSSAAPGGGVRPLSIDELLALGRPIVLAHAGGEDQHPHSTPFAFAESAAAGVDVLDMDVQLSADGVLVVHHDTTVDRTTDGSGDVAAMTYAELQALDNAYWFTHDCVCRDRPADAYVHRGIRTGDRPPPPGYTAEDFTIPRFADIATRFPALPLNVEVKGEGDAAIDAARVLAAELVALDRVESTVVSSFDDAVVAAFQGFAPDVAVSPGLGVSAAFILGDEPLPPGMRILQLPPEFQGIEVLSDANVAKIHAAGGVVWVWPNDRRLENLESYRSFLERGMDGLNINLPALGVAALDDFLGGMG